MSDAPKWKETEGYWLPDHTLLSDEDLAKCARAYDPEGGDFPSPVPTRMVSNGEYLPIPQTKKQKQVEARIEELADSAAKKLGLSRRQFLAGTGGMAAAFLAMNEVFGRFFNVSPAAMFEAEAFTASGPPRDLFVVDDQLHFVRGSVLGPTVLRAIAQGPTTPGFPTNPFNPTHTPDEFGNPYGVWNPALIGMPITPDMFHIVQFIKSIYFDSQVDVGLISNVTAFVPLGPGGVPMPLHSVEEARPNEILTAAQTAAGRDFINQLAGSRRAMAHGLLYVGKGNLHYIDYQINHHRPDAWKGYNISGAAKVDSDPRTPMVQWRHDDEKVAYPTFELISQNVNAGRLGKGGNVISVHKGLARGLPPKAENGYPSDLPKALKDWPNLNFVTYHSCIQDSFFDDQAFAEIRASEAGTRPLMAGVPNIDWVTPFAVMTAGFKNSFGEIGTTFASSVVTFPTVTAHILGQLLKFKGHEQIVFGSDSLWYGSPQWQIEALWRFQIPDAIAERWGYPQLTEAAKRAILGLNSAKLYGLKPRSGAAQAYRPLPSDFEQRIPDDLKVLLEFPPNPPNQTAQEDNLSGYKERYLAMGAQPSHTRYGWIRVSL